MSYRPATATQRAALNRAVDDLRNARDAVILANCPGLLRKIRSALKSAEGAQRHMRHRLMHSNPNQS